MNLGLRNAMSVNATAISNEFIDTYMAAANGEYVKVFLYLLRHEHEDVTVSAIADALNHTEADVKRALAYWKEAGVLEVDAQALSTGRDAQSVWTSGYVNREDDVNVDKFGRQWGADESAATAQMPGGQKLAVAVDSVRSDQRFATTAIPADSLGAPMPEIPEPGNSFERMQKLSDDVEFSALLHAIQQYLGKTFTQIECEKFAYFYDCLEMPAELLEYLAEYCANGGHTSIRYIEKVALNWYQMGIKTREEARDYTMRFSKDMSSVMKAFGITNRNPGTAEQEFMKKWFKEFGFDCALVTEACNRTITATGSASFPYADKILTGWKENGVRTLGDVQELDKRRQMAKTQQDRSGGTGQGGQGSGYSRNQRYAGQKSGGQKSGVQRSGSSGNNRFKNFEERSYDYENLVWEGMRKRQKGGSGDGTQ